MGRTAAPDFKAFWNAYGLKRERQDAERAWNGLSAQDRRAAVDGIAAYRESCRERGVAMKYAQGYLHQRLWERFAAKAADKIVDPRQIMELW